MTQTAPVTSQQRYTKFRRCPICDGYAAYPQGKSIRCAGFLSSDEKYAFCTREEHAGALEPHPGIEPPSYMHALNGSCNCGTQHGAPLPGATNGHKPYTKSKPRANDGERRIVAEYSYHDTRGRLLYQAVRYEPKGFNQRRPDGKGKWAWNMQGVTYVPYRLPDLLRNREATVYTVEGEKDADNLAHIGLVATTNVQGAGKWREEYNQYFKGRNVVILPDNDDKGREHTAQVAESLKGTAASIKIVALPNLPDKGDASNWLAAGGTREQLEQIVKDTAPTWEASKRKFLYASEVKTEPVDYLWTKRLARGMLTLLVGDPGLGKSMLTSKLVAATTTGGVLPDGKAIEPGGVVVMAPEDSYEHTIVPRLIAAGADLSKIILLSEVTETTKDGEIQRPISFPEDANILEEAIADCQASLAIIDPVLAMVNGKYDSHKDQEARAALGRVLGVAQRQKCALLGIFHLNKSQSGNVLYRSGASIAFIAMARIGLFLVPDPDNPENGRVLVNHKNNLAAKATSLCFSIEQTADEIGYVKWQRESPYTEDQLLNQATPTDNPRSEQEMGIIRVLRADGRAMTISQIHAKLETDQSLDAVEKMISRKFNQGILIKPARGLYTYNGNPLYTAKSETTKEDVGNVGNVPLVNDVGSVGNSNGAVSDMSESMNGIQATSDEAREQTDTSDTKNYVGFDVSTTERSMNGHQKPVETQNKPKIGQIIAQMLAQGYGYPKKCGNPSHRGETRWMPQQNPETGKWDGWYCCQCVQQEEGQA